MKEIIVVPGLHPISEYLKGRYLGGKTRLDAAVELFQQNPKIVLF